MKPFLDLDLSLFLEKDDFIKQEFNYSGVEGTAEFLGGNIIVFKTLHSNNVSAISFDDVLSNKDIKNISNKILRKLEILLLFGSKLDFVYEIYGVPHSTDSILNDLTRYHYFLEQNELYLCFCFDNENNLDGLEIVSNKEIIKNRLNHI